MNPTTHFISSHINFQIKIMDFPFPPLKLSNKKRVEYFNFFCFHSILFPPSKRAVSDQHLTQTHTNQIDTHDGKKTKPTNTQNDKKTRYI